ncbi:MAG TPA: hypothetical protein VHR66_27900 [Gemmataceae bacterium]|jgi:hypothetical protein|nr:hypothetical protein [Gemmataceae bacterium]
MSDLADIVANPKALSRIIGKMKRRRQIYETRIQMGDFNGEPRKVVSLYKMYAPAHDNAITKLMKALDWPEAEKPTNIESVGVGDDITRPDVVTLFPKIRSWEMDMETEREDEIKKKVKAYALQSNAVLWVCPTEGRRARLIAWCKRRTRSAAPAGREM